MQVYVSLPIYNIKTKKEEQANASHISVYSGLTKNGNRRTTLMLQGTFASGQKFSKIISRDESKKAKYQGLKMIHKSFSTNAGISPKKAISPKKVFSRKIRKNGTSASSAGKKKKRQPKKTPHRKVVAKTVLVKNVDNDRTGQKEDIKADAVLVVSGERPNGTEYIRYFVSGPLSTGNRGSKLITKADADGKFKGLRRLEKTAVMGY